MNSKHGWAAGAALFFLAWMIVSCQGAADTIPTLTSLPSLTPSQTPQPSLAPTPWPTRIPQDKSNCPGQGWTLYTEESGLAGSDLKTIAVGPDGVIWAADFYGKIAWLYNGKWSTLPLDPIPQVNVIIPLESGSLWLGTQGGQVVLLEGQDQIWTSRVIPMEKGGTAVYDLAVSPQGRLWAATWDGLFALWGEEWTRIPRPVPEYVDLYSPKSLYFDSLGGLWVGARHTFNYYFQGAWSGPAEGIPELINVEDIELDHSGRLWFGSLTGAFVHDGKAWVRVYPDQDSPSEINQVKSLAVDLEGRVWLISSRDAVRYEGGSWQQVSPEVELPEISLRSVEVDSWGALWFVSNAGLVCYLP